MSGKQLEVEYMQKDAYTSTRFKIFPYRDECCKLIYPRTISSPKWPWIIIMVLLREYVQNVQSSLEIVMQDNYAMCKIFPITFRGSVCAWYNNLESGSLTSLGDLCTKLVAWFNTSIPIKKSSTKLYKVTQADDESTLVYLKRFDEKMLKVKELIEHMAFKALIHGAKGRAL